MEPGTQTVTVLGTQTVAVLGTQTTELNILVRLGTVFPRLRRSGSRVPSREGQGQVAGEEEREPRHYHHDLSGGGGRGGGEARWRRDWIGGGAETRNSGLERRRAQRLGRGG